MSTTISGESSAVVDPGQSSDEVLRLRERVAELERERSHLVTVVDILTEVSASPRVDEILQVIARKLGSRFGLDRCSICLLGARRDVRLMATYTDPGLRNLILDLDRYPELRQAFDSGETVFIPDASQDPMFQSADLAAALRHVRSIVVVPIRWRGTVIGAIFLRTDRGAAPFSEADVRFCQVVATLTASALRNAHQMDQLRRAQQDTQRDRRQDELQRIALLAFMRRLLDRHRNVDDHMWAETLLPDAASDELDRLVSVVMEVVREESREAA